MGLVSDLIQKVKISGNGIIDSAIQGIGSAAEFVRKNPATSAATIGGGILAGGTVVQIARKASAKRKSTKKKSTKTSKSSSSKRKKTHTKRGWKLDRAKRSKEKHEVAYQKRKRAAKKTGKSKPKKKPGIYTAKNGTRYKIMANGKAKFIKGGKRR